MKIFKSAILFLALLALVIGTYWYFEPKDDFRVTVSIGSLKQVKQALSKGADVNAICADDGKTPLIKAVWRKNPSVEVLKSLLKAGADTSIKDQLGSTALDYACDNCNSELVAILSPL